MAILLRSMLFNEALSFRPTGGETVRRYCRPAASGVRYWS